jgi:hypothetical protein
LRASLKYPTKVFSAAEAVAEAVEAAVESAVED